MGNRKTRIAQFVAGFLLAAFLIFGAYLGFAFLLNKNLNGETTRYLSETAAQSVRTVKSELEDSLAYLKDMETVLLQFDSLEDPTVLPMLEAQKKHHLFSDMMIITPEGRGTATDGQTYDVVRRDYYLNALEGKQTISDVQYSVVDGEESIVFCIPIYRGDKFLGALSCTYHLDMLKEILSTDTMEGKTTVTLMKRDGKMLTPSDDISMYMYYYKMLGKAELKNGVTVKQVRDRIYSDQSGLIEYDFKGKNYYDYYAPVEMNDWYLVATVPTSVIDAQAHEITRLAVCLMVAVGAVLLLCVLYFYRMQGIVMRQMKKRDSEMDALTANIPGGVQVRRCNPEMEMAYCSRGFQSMTGYTEQEIAENFHNSLKAMVCSEDAPHLYQKIKEQIEQRSGYEVEYRLYKKDGSLCWVLDKGQMVPLEKGKSALYCVIVDVTKSKIMQQELQMSEERFQTIMEKTDSIIFEWNIQDDFITFSDVWQKKFGYPATCKAFTQNMEQKNILHPDDLKICEEVFDAARRGNPYGETVVRFSKKSGGYVWCRVCMTAIFDESGVPCRAVGIVLDVDKEKRKTETLQERAEKDFLTQVYNRGATVMLIQDYLKDGGADSRHALMVMDVDNFKSVNDTLGHSAGDTLLAEIGKRLQKPFRATDVVGRVGGDEFVVFMRNISDEKLIRNKMQLVCDMFHEIPLGENGDYHVSGSIGVALYPTDGETYEELFRHADSALYQAKNGGKDRFCLYGGSRKEEPGGAEK